jgi:hypothetical protein
MALPLVNTSEVGRYCAKKEVDWHVIVRLSPMPETVPRVQFLGEGHGALITSWGSLGTGRGEFTDRGPRSGIAVDSENNRIHVFDSGLNFVMSW